RWIAASSAARRASGEARNLCPSADGSTRSAKVAAGARGGIGIAVGAAERRELIAGCTSSRASSSAADGGGGVGAAGMSFLVFGRIGVGALFFFTGFGLLSALCPFVGSAAGPLPSPPPPVPPTP